MCVKRIERDGRGQVRRKSRSRNLNETSLDSESAGINSYPCSLMDSREPGRGDSRQANQSRGLAVGGGGLVLVKTGRKVCRKLEGGEGFCQG